MAESTSKTYWKILIALSLVHFSGDFYRAFDSWPSAHSGIVIKTPW
jgi:hypothetical protein